MQKTTPHTTTRGSRKTTTKTRPTHRHKQHLHKPTPLHSTSHRTQTTQKQPQQPQQQQQKSQPPQYLNINITPWPLDTQLSDNAKSALVGDATIFFRSMFGDSLPPKAHFCGEISFPYTIKHATLGGSGGGNSGNKKGEVNPMYMGLSQALCESLLHQNYLPQSSLDILMNSPTQPQSSSTTTTTQTTKTKPNQSPQPHLVHLLNNNKNNNNEIGLDHPSAKDILAIYSQHFNHDSTSTDSPTSPSPSTHPNPDQSTSQPTIPIPAYIIQGSYNNVKALSSTLKTYLNNNYLLSPPLLAKIFNIPLDTIRNNSALVEFLQTRHISLLSSYLLGRLVVSLDSNYSPIHLTDLPNFANNHTINTDTTQQSSQQPQQQQHSYNSNPNPLPLNSSDAIANVIERQSSPLIPLSFLPRQRYGGNRDQDYNHLRATKSITNIKIHHGFAEPPKPHPTNRILH